MAFYLIKSKLLTKNCGLPLINWIHATPIQGPVCHSVLHDVISFFLTKGNTLEKAAALACAPTYESLVKMGFNQKNIQALSRNDLHEQEATETEYYLLSRVLYLLSQKGCNWGLVVYNPHYYDSFSRFAIDKLMEYSSATGFNVAIVSESGNEFLRKLQSTYTFNVIKLTLSKTVIKKELAKIMAGVHLPALFSTGISLSLFNQLGGSIDANSIFVIRRLNEEWVFIPQKFMKPQPSLFSEANLAELLKRYPSEGFEYIYKQNFYLQSKKWSIAKTQHILYLLGIRDTGKALVCNYYLRLVAYRPQMNPDEKLSFSISLARILPFSGYNNPTSKAIHYYKDALRQTTSAADKIALIYEVANSHAVKKTSSHLSIARSWYKKGYDLLKRISDNEDHARLSIRLNNGLALVEYHDKNNEKALQLEMASKELAGRVQDTSPSTAKWAIELLNTNTAKLLETRFKNREAALEFLCENLRTCEEKYKFSTSLNIARLHFDKHDFQKVHETLSHFYDNGMVVTNDDDFFFGLILLLVSAHRLGNSSRFNRYVNHIDALGKFLNFDADRLKQTITAHCKEFASTSS